jgi:hypothetical protein
MDPVDSLLAKLDAMGIEPCLAAAAAGDSGTEAGVYDSLTNSPAPRAPFVTVSDSRYGRSTTARPPTG